MNVNTHILIKLISPLVLLALTTSSCKSSPENEPAAIVNEQATTEATPLTIIEAGNTITPTPSAFSDSMFLYTKAVSELRAEEYKDAINTFSMVIKRVPELAIAYKGRGAAYYYEKQYSLAKTDLTKAIELDAELGGAYLYLGKLYKDQGKHELATIELRKSISFIHPVREHLELEIAQETLLDVSGK